MNCRQLPIKQFGYPLPIKGPYTRRNPVITSYSIHYTKLYDSSSNLFYREVLKRLVNESKFNRLNVRETIITYPALKQVIGDELAKKFLGKFSEWSRYFVKDKLGSYLSKVPSEFIYDCMGTESAEEYARNNFV